MVYGDFSATDLFANALFYQVSSPRQVTDKIFG